MAQSIRDLYVTERVVCAFARAGATTSMQHERAAEALNISPGEVRRRLAALANYRKGLQEKKSSRKAHARHRTLTANASTLQHAAPTQFVDMVNEILTGDRLYAPVKTY